MYLDRCVTYVPGLYLTPSNARGINPREVRRPAQS